MQYFENINDETPKRNNISNNTNNTNKNIANYSQAMQGINPQTMGKTKAYQLVYPEIYYKLQPYIMMVCDQMDAYNTTMPNQEMIENMTDSIYDDVVRMFPDIADYVRSNESNDTTEQPGAIATQLDLDRRRDRDRDRDPRFRRRGLFRDLIDILFLTELLRRRRR